MNFERGLDKFLKKVRLEKNSYTSYEHGDSPIVGEGWFKRF